ncbi:DUF2213 domain-containing protein [Pararhizobium antarcticum]|uniref:DUF2213 domain-containing protein n=1 Tax=Pararhizobium antarcticum TaxID=1798805 RepID=A0A657LU77_9HYPH|nr:DUF2213 domain-containing protein [Pararhizobium antarcticum]OJF97587.1 hypothetical protein AX760_16620 [Pararhizobium antarcticum]
MNFTDAVTVSGTRRTADGYLVAEAKAVRTGVQLYSGKEVGREDLSVVRVYRGADQVFAQDSLQSFTHAPVTNDHPAESVTAENWKALAVGEVSTAAKRDGDWVMLPLILKDAKAIQSVESGKRELSAGYVCELDWTAGVTADGQAFDAQQKNIKINHLALVDRARAGSQARIGDGAGSWGVSPVTNDHKPEKEKIMTLKTVTVDGIPVEVTDQGAIVITTLQTRLADAVAKLTATETAHQTAIAAKDAELAKKDAELDATKSKVLSDADLDKKVQARADLIAVAKTIAKDVKTEGLTDAGIRKAVVIAKIGDAAVAGKADAYIDVRFDLLVDDAAKGAPDPFAALVKDGIKPTNDASTSDAAHKAMTDHMTSAWQTKGAA